MRISTGHLRIAVNGRFLSRPATGVDRFATETLRALDDILETFVMPDLEAPSVELLTPPGCSVPAYRRIRHREVPGPRSQRWEQWHLPRACESQFLVNLCNTAPIGKRDQLVVIHDAATWRLPGAFSPAFRRWYKFLLPIVARTSRQVATVSNFSRGELAQVLRLEEKRIRVLPEGAEHLHRLVADPSVLRRHALGSKPFVLAVSSVVPHKNFGLIVEALGQLKDTSFDVAIAGRTDKRVFGSTATASDPRIKWLGYVSDAELRALYEGAGAFVFPSLYEGFGLPPLEAMSFGCPVICSNRASMPEVCGDAAIFIDPQDPAALATVLRKVIGSASLRDQLCEQGLRHSAQWTWHRTAVALLLLLYEAQGQNAPDELSNQERLDI